MAAYLRVNPGVAGAPVTAEEVLADLRSRGIRVPIDEAAVRAAVEAPTGEPVAVASGVRPTEPQPGRLEPLFPEPPQLLGPDQQTIRQVPYVEPGTDIAVIRDPVAGREGTDVFGQPIRARLPVRARVFLGPGTSLNDDGRTIYATVAGRPVYWGRPDRPMVRVAGAHLHQGDVTPKTGNLHFKGDVVVTGSVRETMRVAAEGSIKILGGVTVATIEAGQHVEITGVAANAKILAGGVLGVYTRVTPLLEDLVYQLDWLRTNVEYLLRHPSFQRVETQKVEFGRVIRLMLDSKLKTFPAAVRDLVTIVRNAGDAMETDVADLVKRLSMAFGDQGQSQLRSMQDLASLADTARRTREALDTVGLPLARVQVGGTLHSTISCSGDVETGPDGALYSEITALGRVTVAGRLSGGAVYGRSGIRAAQVGAPAATVTELRVGAAASVSAQVAHPGTVIRIGDTSRRLERNVKALEARLDGDGKLQIQGGDLAAD